MEKSCSQCPEPTLAQSLCTLCNKWLCYQCTDVHQHQRPAAASHYIELQHHQRPGASQCADAHQRGSSSLPPPGQGPGSHPCPLLMCHSHRQEPLELFCESCDLLCCSSCHLSSHKNHRVVPIGKALQDQQWLFDGLMVQVEERRSAVENNAKQIEDRLHGVKIAHRKAENQIKMAKMIMMNELNKRANLLIEQLEKISEDFQQRLEDQLQGAIETCGQLDHVQKFITWATTHHCKGPVLFSRALTSLQMQQLLEPSLQSDAWSPVKIKFNWDASYWTKQISSLGQLTVEGGTCTYPQSLACSSIRGPPANTCMTLPSACSRGLDPGCGYPVCCEPQMWCLHGFPPQTDRPSLDKGQLEASLYNPSCVQPALMSGSMYQSQRFQKCWGKEKDEQRQGLAPASPVKGSIQLSYSRGSASQLQAADSHHQSQSKSYPSYLQQQREVLPSSQLSWEKRCRAEDAHRQEGRGLLNEELQQEDGRQQSPVQHRTRPGLMIREHRDGRRSTSLGLPATARDRASHAAERRHGPRGAVRREEEALPEHPGGTGSPRSGPGADGPNADGSNADGPNADGPNADGSNADGPAGHTLSLEAGAARKFASVDPRQRRASDGLLCVVKEASSASSRVHRFPLLTYKTEPDQSFTYVNEELDFEAGEKFRSSRSDHSSNGGAQKDSARPKVPVVCLERLKILVSQLPPHGRRQSDPLPASALQTEAPPQPRTWSHVRPEGMDGGSETGMTALQRTSTQSDKLSTDSEFNIHDRLSFHTASTQTSADLKYVPQSYSALDLDSDSDLRSVSEDAAVSQVEPNPQRDSDLNVESLSEAEHECAAGGKAAAAGETGACAEPAVAADSEPSLEYEAEPESDAGVGSEESGDAETESDLQPGFYPGFQADTDSDIVSDQHPDSAGFVESELDIDSEPEGTTDEPQPLRSDLEEDCRSGAGQRQLLIANPAPEPEPEPGEAGPERDHAQMENEDFCAVCLIGGDLLCCDRCPKVFHLSCHIPSLLSFPSGDWVCSLCRDVLQPEVVYDCENERTPKEQSPARGLSARDQRKCERLTLLILSNILSAPFHEPVSPLARHYYQIIKRPMDLSVIRAKLRGRNAPSYNSPDEFVADVYLMFRNCAKFNYPDSEVAQAGRSLEAFFTSKLQDVFPDAAFPAAEADSDSDEYDEAYRTADGGFPWPERREQCHRKRKRRHSVKPRRHHF
ncbi:LOW QUALITY PROTEIN: tripartite motif-containing protein 66 [Betta splendens]|uniref:LOW QUALITY PROTEIN: tripartite motif-containing protein 66 n=1 Tax=Betta splendens TaxID=158456 RepID=A0A6P7M2S9_BETSP|nr:LOW QUALITY PROTEIN: tripartite motif-containing protein 66 [Betta splendens]